MRKTIQTKTCIWCKGHIQRTYQNNKQWRLQEAHGGTCRNAQNKVINNEYKQNLISKRFFKRS